MAGSKMSTMLDSLNRQLASEKLSASRRKRLLKMRTKLRRDMAQAGVVFVSGGLPSLGKRR